MTHPFLLLLAIALCLGTPPLHAADAGQERAARYYEDALTRYERRDVAGAIIQLKNALQIDKNLLPVQVLLGKALLANGEAVAAGVALTEALRLGVDRAEVIVPLASALVAQGRQASVLEEPRFSPAGLPPQVQRQMLLIRAAASADVDDMPGALRTIDEARRLDPRSVDVWLAEVPVRIRLRQFREAIAAADQALAIAPQAAEAWYHKGSVAHVQGDLRGALDAYTRALQSEPRHADALVARAGIFIDLRQPAEAAKDVAALQHLSPQEPRGAYLEALLAQGAGDAAKADAALRRVTALLDPVPMTFIRYRPQLLMLNGLAHFALNEQDKARLYLESFQKIQATSATSKVLAQIYLSAKNVDRAIAVLEPYLRAEPDDAQALALLASAHMAQGRNAKATSLMQEALRRQDRPALRTTLGLSLLGAGQAGNALAELEAAFEKDPSQTQAGAALVGLYLSVGQSAKAVAVAKSLVARQPGHAGFHDLLGTAQARHGNPAEARAAFEQATRLDRALVQPQLNLARLDRAAKAYEPADARLAALLSADDKNVDVLLEMAALASERGRAVEVQRWLEKANDHAGRREVRPGLALIDLHQRSGRAPAALEAARRLAGKAPDDVQVLLALSRAQLASGDATGARVALKNATRIAEFDAPRQLEIALLQLTAQNLDGAVYSLEKGLSARPDFLPALALMTDLELRRGEVAQAEQRARGVVQAHPTKAIGHSLLGDVARARSQPAAALAAYRQAHQLEPSSETLLRLFRAQFTQGQTQPALQLAEQWARKHPGDLAVRKALGDGHASVGNDAAARKAYEDVLQTAPRDAQVLNNLANVLARSKDPSALAVAERALAADPGNPHVIDTLGWLSYQSGQTDRALQLLRDARLREPRNQEIRYHLAVVLAAAGRKGEARAELESALATQHAFESRPQAQALLRTVE